MIYKKVILSVLMLLVLALNAMPAMAEMVIYNIKTGKFHSLKCRQAKQCSENCIKIE